MCPVRLRRRFMTCSETHARQCQVPHAHADDSSHAEPHGAQGGPANSCACAQAAAAGLLGAMLLLPALGAGWALLRRSAAAFGGSLQRLVGAVPPALVRVWRLGQQLVLAAALRVCYYGLQQAMVRRYACRIASGTNQSSLKAGVDAACAPRQIHVHLAYWT